MSIAQDDTRTAHVKAIGVARAEPDARSLDGGPRRASAVPLSFAQERLWSLPMAW